MAPFRSCSDPVLSLSGRICSVTVPVAPEQLWSCPRRSGAALILSRRSEDAQAQPCPRCAGAALVLSPQRWSCSRPVPAAPELLSSCPRCAEAALGLSLLRRSCSRPVPAAPELLSPCHRCAGAALVLSPPRRSCTGPVHAALLWPCSGPELLLSCPHRAGAGHQEFYICLLNLQAEVTLVTTSITKPINESLRQS